jgi:putative glycosyltransferase (TIGR04348 family)
MKIHIVTPTSARQRTGNAHTAVRWAAFLRGAGHRVRIMTEWDHSTTDMMVALHARRSHQAIADFAERFPDRPLVVVLTGTDLYRDIRDDPKAQQSLQLAHRLVVLQERGLDELAHVLRQKTTVVYQSASAFPSRPRLKRAFEVCVSGHLREEKDPFRAALASNYLPENSRIRITHIGAALTRSMDAQARALAKRFPRYRWLGPVPHWKARQLLARSALMVISSRMEGGANVICEAVMSGVPVIASDVAGNIGMLGADYAGYYPWGNEHALAEMLSRAELDAGFYGQLVRQCAARRPLFDPARESADVIALVESFCGAS